MEPFHCDAKKRCNSCQLLNLSIDDQLKLKQNICKKMLGALCQVHPIAPSPLTLRYRNKAQFVFKSTKDGYRFGIFKSTTGSAALTNDCLLCTERQNEVAAVLCALLKSFKIKPYDFHTGAGWLKSVLLREGFRSGEMMAVLIGADRKFPAKKTFASALKQKCPYLTTAVLSENRDARKINTGAVFETLFGEGVISDELCGKSFLISPASFYQINPLQTERLYEKAIELAWLERGMTVLDAYCGVGTIGICAADRVKKVIAVEKNRAAIADARKNAKRNDLSNIDFVCADAKDFIKTLKDSGEKIDVAFIDPPRAGCAASFLNALSKLSPKKIVYISCNPETQARDIKLLHRLGYNAEVCYPFDLFPNTSHVEAVVMMSRKNAENH